MSLPFGYGEFNVSSLALVNQYIPDRTKATSEITRVVKAGGGGVAAYVWPALGDGHPMQPLTDAVKSIGVSQSCPPGNQIRTIETLTELFLASGLEDIENRAMEFPLTYKDCDDYWLAQTVETIRNVSDGEIERLKAVLLERLGVGEISYTARANAIKGHLPT